MDGLFKEENGVNVKAPYREMWFDYNVDIGSAQTEHRGSFSSSLPSIEGQIIHGKYSFLSLLN